MKTKLLFSSLSRAIKNKLFVVLLLSSGLTPFLNAQPPEFPGTKKMEFHGINESDQGQILYINNQAETDTANIVPNSFIVEFKGETIADIYKKEMDESERKVAITEQVRNYENLFNTFESDMNSIYRRRSRTGRYQNSSTDKNKAKPVFGDKYIRVFLGQHITIDEQMVDEIKKLSYVRTVYHDRIVKATLDESVHQIGADSIWNEFGCEGDSIRVGIIDTGIDYTHPDLGGGFGPGYKVVAGYDFVSLDGDPMDDHIGGHGTHVAGIVAADGVVKGVAPKAWLYALKVLNKEGYGSDNVIISAVEYTVDPNGDYDFSDMLDVVNMSLGGYPTEEDPLVDAVEAAISLGVTYCIAAGNNGDMGVAGTIDSPGTSLSAITVGAVDKLNILAFFSSWGPTQITKLLKPDVLAPGVDINSTLPHNKYDRYSGTSMATPHISGICALLKQLHPLWAPSEMKAAIMLTARDIGLEKVMQGAGVVDAYHSAVTKIMVNKPSLNFGIDTLNADQLFSACDTFILQNTGAETQSYTLEIVQPGPGISISLSDMAFSLDPDETIPVIVSLDVDNSILKRPIVRGSLMHNGEIRIHSNTETVHMNWAFSRWIRAEIKVLNGKVYNVFIFDKESFYSDIQIPYWSKPDSFLIYPDEYYVVAEFDDRTAIISSCHQRILIKKLNIDSNCEIVLDGAETTKAVVFDTEDELGKKYVLNMGKDRRVFFLFDDSIAYQTMRYSGDSSDSTDCKQYSEYISLNNKETILLLSQINYYTNNEVSFRKMDTLWYNTPPEGTKVLIAEMRRDKNDGYHMCFNTTRLLDELGDVTVLTGNSTDYKTLNFEKEPTVIHPHTAYWLHHWQPKLWWKSRHFIENEISTNPGTDSAITAYTLFMPESEEHTVPLFYYPMVQEGGLESYISPPIECFNDTFYFGNGKTPGAIRFLENDTVTFGAGGLYIFSRTSNNATEPFDDSVSVCFFPCILGSLMEDYYFNFWHFWLSEEICGMEIFLYDENETLIDSSVILMQSNPAPGRYHIAYIRGVDDFLYEFPMDNRVDIWFDTRKEDADPPSVITYHTRNSLGKETQLINKNNSVTLIFSAADEQLLKPLGKPLLPIVTDSTKLFVKYHFDNEWTLLDIDSLGYDPRVGTVFTATYAQTDYDSAYFDVKIILVDDAGNRTQLVITPAFYVRNILPPIAVSDFYILEANRLYTSNVPVAMNDVNPFGYPKDLKVHLADDVNHGELNLPRQGNLAFTYMPDTNYSGSDFFTYYISNELYSSEAAVVTLTIIPPTEAIENTITKQNGFLVFPNPAKDFLNICVVHETSENLTIKLLDLKGRIIAQVFTGFVEMGACTFKWEIKSDNGNKVQPGVYVLSVHGNGLNELEKVIIE